jgi:DivIVA domain-containing protein
MGAKEIMSRKFEMVLRGYKTEEVEEFLREVSLGFSRLQKENEDLEKKLEVLADKIREYREDEDTLKDALLGAQRQGNALIADSKRKAAEVAEEAQSNAEAIAKRAEEDRLKKKMQGEEEIAAAQKEASDIIAAANRKAAEIEREMNLRTDVQKEILHRTAEEVSAFKAKIVEHYKKQMETIKRHYNEELEIIEKISSECENEFIRGTLKEERPNLAEKSAKGGQERGQKGFEKGRERKNRENASDMKSPKFETTDISSPPDGSGDEPINAVKFEIDVNGDTAEEIYGAEQTGDTGEIPFFKPKDAGNSNHKQTSEIFFKKSTKNRG